MGFGQNWVEHDALGKMRTRVLIRERKTYLLIEGIQKLQQNPIKQQVFLNHCCIQSKVELLYNEGNVM